MSISEMIIDLSEDYNEPRIENLSVECQDVTVESAPGAPQAPIEPCPSLKYSGNTVTLQATPTDGTGPYIVTFKKNGTTIDDSRLVDEFSDPTTNPTTDAPEDVQITRVYTLDDLDISSALTGDITFSVEISDSCPTGPMTCSSECVIAVGCVTPVCNFTVT